MTREEQIRQEIDLRLAGSSGNYTEGYEEGFIGGAKWADDSRPQSYSKQELRDMGFAFDLNGNVLSPNELTSKAAHYVIEKACEWLKGQLIDNQDNCGYPVVSTFDTTTVEEFICDFKKAMEL